MRNFFKHKYIVNLLALLALVFSLLSFFAPKIREYNSAVEYKQKQLHIQANGSSGQVISFSADYINEWSDPTFYAEIAFSFALFFSLMFTRRIIFSFLFIFLFASQFTAFYQLFFYLVDFPMSYFINTPVYAPLFVACVLVFSYWQSSIIYRIYCENFQAKDNLK